MVDLTITLAMALSINVKGVGRLDAKSGQPLEVKKFTVQII